MDTWLPFCVKRPGPDWKQGYPNVSRRTLAEIEGEVDHSMEGYRGGAYAVLDGPIQSSWTFSIYRSGPPEQHYPLESITWHAGLPGDRRTDTSLIGNLTLVGKEHEGIREDLTPSQLDWSLKITQAIRGLAPHIGTPALRVNLFEHNWLTSTSCPSGRIPWQVFLQEDEMTEADWARMAGLIRGAVLAIGTGQMNSGMKNGDPDWTPPMDLKDVMDKLAAVERTVNRLQAGTAPKKVLFPGATIKISPVDMPVE